MCRYGMTTYKPHYACFDCRKTFKRRLLFDVEGGNNKNSKETKARCPECGGLLADMGLDFESPKKSDLKAWKHLRHLYIAAITFHSCGCTGPGYIPHDHQSLVTHLERIKKQYIDHWRFWKNRVEPTTDSESQKDWLKNGKYLLNIPYELNTGTKKKKQVDIDKAIEYWSNNIENIERSIKQLS